MLTEPQFRLEADRALGAALGALVPLAEQEGFDVELHDGVLQLVFDRPSPAKFIVNAHAPARQIWVSARARGYRLAWDADTSTFALDGEPLAALLGRLTRQFLAAS